MDVLATNIQLLIGDLSRVLDDGSPSRESVDALAVKAEHVQHLMVLLVDIVPWMERNLHLIESVISRLNNVYLETDGIYSNYSMYGYSAPRFVSGERGRLRVSIPRDMLEYLIGNYFSVHRVAQLLKASVSTVRRRMNEFGISVRSIPVRMSEIEFLLSHHG